VGLLFTAGIYPMTMILWQREQAQYTDAMMLSLYVTLGILLLIGVRSPSENRSLIAFAGWSSLAHATVMAIMALRQASNRAHLLIGVTLFGIIGAALVMLAPAKRLVERLSAPVA
jgi:cytochrome b561